MEKIPYHIAIIPDGNRRWARENGLSTFYGHKTGIENFKKISSFARKKGIKVLTFFAFSTENWKRQKTEVDYLIRLFKRTLNKYIDDVHREGIRLIITGDKKGLPKDFREAVYKSEKLTQNNKNGILNLALNYGGRREILGAVKKILIDKPSNINENIFKKYLWTENIPDPDLIIRTGGEKRISNFLLWEMAYSELYFSRKYWPDFTTKDFSRILSDFAKRKRRFGK